MSRFSKLAVATTVLAGFAFAAPALASSPGQLATGPNIYRVKDVTSGGSYANTITASACDTVQYSTELNNGGYGDLTNVIVKATVANSSSTSHVSNMTATPAEGSTYGTSGTATVSVSPAQSLSYVNGSAKLYDVNGNLIKVLPDTITSGVNVGTIAGSTTEFVTFQAKLSCPTPTPTPKPTPTPQAKSLPNTGAGDVLGIFTGASSLGAAGHYLVSRRRRGL